MEEDYKYGIVRQHSGIWKSLREDGDFDEEDVWSILKEEKTPASFGGSLNPKGKVPSNNIVPPPHKPSSLQQASPRIMIPRPNSTNNFITSAISPSIHEPYNKVFQQSAPVNIPDWSKIYGAPKNVAPRHDDDYGDGGGSDDDDEFEEDGEGGGDEYCDYPRLPPHEFIARRLARSQISSFSVLEGVGRTLKGRDLSKVRNAVLSKTGFLE